ncbi:hypothetical protein BD770DRAFT_449237 [Pilaira anomala]|nr:hypothetical protein BD770DRAFT_449237 [Pilaira anomala]
MSPAYNINDLTRMEIAISNLQKDVRDLKDMKSKLTVFVLYSKNLMKLKEQQLSTTESELKINLEDSLETRNQKNDILQALVSQLNSFTRTCVLQLINELDEKEVPEDMRSWKQVPDFMKDKCFLSLELMASSAKISLDRCDVKGKRVTSRVVGESQQESLPNDISTPSDTDDLPSIGSDDEEEALSEYSEPEQDVEEEASAPTDSSSVKRKGRQASSSSVSKKSELAALTHILVLNKHQHSPIAKKVFSDELLDDLAESMVSESMNYNLSLSEQQYMAMAKIINQLSLSKATRENAFIELSLMSFSMNYNERRLVRGLTNLIQKLPKLPLKDNSIISESELWNTYFDPLLSCLICDPEKLVHLRWTNATPNEGGKLRPDAVISKRQQLEYEGNIGKNAIDVNKLEGALAFQIHGFCITFFISRLVSNGIYAFYEVANLHFPESLEDLPSFISLKNITLLLAVNDVFWRLCKKSDKAVTITNRYKETVDLEGLIDASQDCTRTCAMRYGQ